MKRGKSLQRAFLGIIISLLLFFVLFSVSSIFLIKNTSSMSVPTNISIEVGEGPKIEMNHPKENRFYRSYSVLLNYSVFAPDGTLEVFYNLDSLNNISLGNNSSGTLTINTTEGNHTLNLYAIDAKGHWSYESADFNVNDSRVIVWYETFRGNTGYCSADFDTLTDDELENLPGLILERVGYGKIQWYDTLNMTADIYPEDKMTILDYNITIGQGSIFVDEVDMPNLRSRATLWFHNLDFDDPRVLRNGEVCSESICISQNYSGGTLAVDVTGFTIYTVEETPEGNGGDNGNGGNGGAGGGAPPGASFTLDRELIELEINQGESKRELLRITNDGNQILDIEIELDGLENLVAVQETSFTLRQLETKTIILDITVGGDEVPDVYAGMVIVTGDGIIEIVDMSVEVKQVLFDIDVKLNKGIVFPGDEIQASVTMLNKLDKKPINISVYYAIRDFKENMIVFKEETLTIDDKIELTAALKVPEQAQGGRYIFYVKATYGDITAATSGSFEIRTFRAQKVEMIAWIIIFSILCLIVITMIIHYTIKAVNRRRLGPLIAKKT